jgi:type IV pilus assembly protein PilM
VFGAGNLLVQIGNKDIRVLMGNKRRIKFFDTISTPEESFLDDKILNTRLLTSAIKDYITTRGVKAQKISFAIGGQDVVIRHIEIPIMKKEGLDSAVNWEITQYLPNNGENHYVDFQIIEKINTKEKKVYKILVVAAPKTKIDAYVDLANKLNLKLYSMDISSNCLARVFSFAGNKNIKAESIGIINMGRENSSLVILNKGKLFMERELPLGINNIISELAEFKGVSIGESEAEFYKNFKFSNSNVKDETENSIQASFDNIFSSFDKIIQFYSTGRSKKTLDQIYLIGLGANIEGLENYISYYFSTPTNVVNLPKDININMKIPKSFDFKLYVNVFGLLLRKE